MRGIFGLYHRDGRPVSIEILSAIGRRLHGAGLDGARVWLNGACGLGQVSRDDPTRTADECQPRWLAEPRLAFACAARLDARDELCETLNVHHADRSCIRDDDLVLRAYLRWGRTSPDHLLGDWSFAAWHAGEDRLFVARDEQGSGAIYTFVSDQHVAFASNLLALLALPAVSSRLDELHLARMLTSWPSANSTIYRDIARLPRGHTLTASGRGVTRRYYGSLDQVPSLRLATDQEYVDRFRELFARAVADRLRTRRTMAVALSGGLDSGAVAATAHCVRPPGSPPLGALGHVPQFRQIEFPARMCDEAPLIAATARASNLADVIYFDSASITPLGGMRRALEIYGAPTHAAANQFWLVDLLAIAQARGYERLLTGQLGNVTMSWSGVPARPDWRTHWRRGAWRAALVAMLPASWGDRLHAWRRRFNGGQPWRAYSAIHPEFARRLDLAERIAAESHDPMVAGPHHSLELRLRMMRASRGEFAEAALAHGLDIVDPTADLRITRYCLSLPEAQFVGPRGETRWLIRRAMAGVLPPSVLENQRRGLQAADLVLRFRASAGEVDEALGACEGSPTIREYLDVPYLRQTWEQLRSRDDIAAHRHAVAILSPGIMLGLFLGPRGPAGYPIRAL